MPSSAIDGPSGGLTQSDSTVGLDIGATKWLVVTGDRAAINLEGVIHQDPRRTLTEIKIALEQAALQVQRLGCSFAGAVDDEGCVSGWPNRPSWRGFQLARHLKNCAKSGEVTIEDDGVCAAIGELTTARLRGFKNVLCVTFGTGIGSGLVLDGRLRRPVRGQPRSLGHFRVGLDVKCRCGSMGCLQAAVLGPGSSSRRRVHKIPLDGPGMRRLSEVVADFALMMDLDAVVLTGGLLGHLPELKAAITRGITQELRSDSCRVIAADRPAYSAALGAYALAGGWQDGSISGR